jgi:hypothetical protein
MIHVVSPEERANRLMWIFEPDKDFDAAKKNAIAKCEEMISEDPNHFKGGERYYYEVYYHLIKYPKIEVDI